MDVDDKYALNWDCYADHFKKAFDIILKANDFVDVTLSCEGKKIKAHRVILSACSSYFYDIFKDNPCSHPTIVLRGMKYSDLKYLLKFMYCGEVQVPTEDFGSFLQTAEFLQISGLTGDSDTGSESKLKTKVEDDVKVPERTSTFSPLNTSSVANKRKVSLIEENVLNKKKKESKRSDSEEDELENFSGSDTKEDNEVNDVLKSMPVENIANIQKLLNDNTYLSKDANPECECPVCAEKFISIYSLKQHVPYHLGETKCDICGRIFNRLDLLRKHMVSVHKISINNTKKDR